jgi:hypothetical protein
MQQVISAFQDSQIYLLRHMLETDSETQDREVAEFQLILRAWSSTPMEPSGWAMSMGPYIYRFVLPFLYSM